MKHFCRGMLIWYIVESLIHCLFYVHTNIQMINNIFRTTFLTWFTSARSRPYPSSNYGTPNRPPTHNAKSRVNSLRKPHSRHSQLNSRSFCAFSARFSSTPKYRARSTPTVPRYTNPLPPPTQIFILCTYNRFVCKTKHFRLFVNYLPEKRHFLIFLCLELSTVHIRRWTSQPRPHKLFRKHLIF